ncbi:MAG: DNA gyrase subunit A [Acidobacteria bacterium]|jgi:DNA gyrase subunit A|nr:DNA gyrase subunit A [Acidobacteriota bacterium]|tara:strand:+ start:1915 stop:4347 length:2433 start_codon:yes stop_codon:yes gene_type:complete
MGDIEHKIPVSLREEVEKSYLDYAMSVIVGRALPDIRDGLKPVHRRTLFAMQDLKNFYNQAYKKSARICGDVIGKYHPHGETAVYDTLVRMAQDFSLRNPLVDGQGNFGSLDGDPPAAMRYTEVRMTRLAHEMLADIDKKTVDFSDNYDATLKEPIVLPAKFPNLLVNGSSGIAVGMATNIPPHNLGEVCDAAIELINDPDVDTSKLMEHISGPDFPTGGIIYGANNINTAYKTGRGVIRIRARAGIERTKRKGDSVVITEVPYQVNKARLIEHIANLVRSKKIEGVRDIRDESSREGVRVVIELKSGEEPDVVLNNLWKQTQMESSFGINMIAIDRDRNPKLCTLKKLLEEFIYHRREVVTRRTLFELGKAEARKLILEGLEIALDNLDAVIKLIRGSKDPATAKAQMIKRFKMEPIQAQAVLDMRLHRLTALERDKITAELKELRASIEEFEAILASDKKLSALIVDELVDIKDTYADERRTEIVAEAIDFTAEDLIAEEDMVVTCSHIGYVKRTPLSLYRQQRRGGKGRLGAITKEGDFVAHLFTASTHSYIMVFTEQGKAYWLKVYQVPQAGPASRGKAIANLLERLDREEKVAAILPVSEFSDKQFLVFATEQGLVKKTPLMDFSRPTIAGIIAIKVQEGDRLLSVKLTDGNQNIFLGTYLGKSIRFPEKQCRAMGRNTRGVKGIRLAEADVVVGVDVVGEAGAILTVTENGYGKRTDVNKYRTQNRGGKGLIDIKTSPRNGPVVGQKLVDEDGEVMVITSAGKLIRTSAKGIKVQSRNTQGVKVISLGEGDRVVSVARLREAAT